MADETYGTSLLCFAALCCSVIPHLLYRSRVTRDGG